MTIAVCARPPNTAVAAARSFAPPATGSMLGMDGGGAHGQAAPLAGRGPGHSRRWPARETRSKPSPWAAAPTIGGIPARPWREKGCAGSEPPRVAVAPKPRGVNAVTLPRSPQARSWGSKKLGHATPAGAVEISSTSSAGGKAPRRSCKAAAITAVGAAPPWGADDNRRLKFVASAWRFSSCHAICSGNQGIVPAGHGKPIGVPNSWGRFDRRVMGGLDQWGAVTRACSPMATSTMQPKMRKHQLTGNVAAMALASLHGSVWLALENASVGSATFFVAFCSLLAMTS
mmetsp:Transcript_67187/g.194502  ORF Transcript_67187/g.194502 Transcript_67187/m.194502 type:complete len:287 (-) Transcript_67187:127-987(-)